jgi:hypothetical protein
MSRRSASNCAFGAELVRLRALGRWRWVLMFALVGVAGIALRIWVYRSVMGTPNADEAVVGLMARHAVNGEFTTFYWGQAYGGSQEALLTAPVFLIAGASWVALRLVPMTLSAVAAMLLWRVGRRTIGEPAAAIAGAVFWIWPPFDIYQLTHQQGFYASDVVYCALLLLLALRVVEHPDRIRVGILGFVLGLAFWQTAQIVPIAGGIVAWTIWKKPQCLRHLWVAAPLAALGAIPWIGWNARHNWASLATPDYGDKLRSLRLLISPVLPMMLGLRAPFSAQLLLPRAVAYLLYVGFAVLFVYGAYRARRREASLLYVTAAVFPFIYIISPKTVWAVGTPRFIVVLAPVLVLLLAQVATSYARGVAVVVIAAVVSVVTLYRMDAWFSAAPGRTTNAKGLGPRHAVQWVPRDLSGLVSTLDRLGLDHVYADYWLAYRLDFDTRERIVATESRFEHLTFDHGRAIPSSSGQPRRTTYEREVRQARHGFVFYRQIVSSVPIVQQLKQHGYHSHVTGAFVVYSSDGETGP